VRDKISHSLEESQACQQEGREADGLQDTSPCYVCSARWVASTFDLESGASKADQTEDGEVYPA
jgi:hypothetical protein